MKSTLVCLVITLLAFSVQATEVEPKEIAELVQRSDHILICKVVKVEMLDSDDNEVIDRNSKTGWGHDNRLVLHIKRIKKGTLKTNLKKIPRKITVPLSPGFHYSLGQWQDSSEGKIFIFLLKGKYLQPVYEGHFLQQHSKKKEIIKLIKKDKD